MTLNVTASPAAQSLPPSTQACTEAGIIASAWVEYKGVHNIAHPTRADLIEFLQLETDHDAILIEGAGLLAALPNSLAQLVLFCSDRSFCLFTRTGFFPRGTEYRLSAIPYPIVLDPRAESLTIAAVSAACDTRYARLKAVTAVTDLKGPVFEEDFINALKDTYTADEGDPWINDPSERVQKWTSADEARVEDALRLLSLATFPGYSGLIYLFSACEEGISPNVGLHLLAPVSLRFEENSPGALLFRDALEYLTPLGRFVGYRLQYNGGHKNRSSGYKRTAIAVASIAIGDESGHEILAARADLETTLVERGMNPSRIQALFALCPAG